MGVKVREVKEVTCDVCGAACGENDGNIEIRINSGDGRDVGPSLIKARLELESPYKCMKGIVCIACKIKWLTVYLERLK